MKKLLLLLPLLAILAIGSAFAPTAQPKESINWLSMDEAAKLAKENDKMIFVDIYTTWCGFCKKMDRTTFAHPEIVKYINENFYAVKLDAETRETIVVGEETFKFIPNGKSGMNELAMYLMNGTQGMLPTMVMINSDLSINRQIPGYQTAPDMDMILRYFGEGYAAKGIKWGTYKMMARSKLKK